MGRKIISDFEKFLNEILNSENSVNLTDSVLKDQFYYLLTSSTTKNKSFSSVLGQLISKTSTNSSINNVLENTKPEDINSDLFAEVVSSATLTFPETYFTYLYTHLSDFNSFRLLLTYFNKSMPNSSQKNKILEFVSNNCNNLSELRTQSYDLLKALTGRMDPQAFKKFEEITK